MFSVSTVVALVGTKAFEKGRVLQRQNKVGQPTVSKAGNAVTSRVAGTLPRPYTTVVTFALTDAGWQRPLMTMCSCPVAGNCKHGAAVLLQILHDRQGAQAASMPNNALTHWQEHRQTQQAQQPLLLFGQDMAPHRHSSASSQLARSTPAEPTLPPWERLLSPIAQATNSDSTDSAHHTALAVQFELLDPKQHPIPRRRTRTGKRSASPYRLGMRPVLRADSGNWVRTGVNWARIYGDEFATTADETQLAWFRSIDQLAKASDPDTYYSTDANWIMLDTLDSPLLWPFLEQGAQLAIPTLNSKKGAPPVAIEHTRATVNINAVAGPRGLKLQPHVTLGDTTLPREQVGYLGSPAHGIFVWQGSGDNLKNYQITLARLSQPIAEEVKALLTQAKPVSVPKKDVDRFAAEYVPSLQRSIAVVSTDESLTIAEIAPPRLVLSITAGQGGGSGSAAGTTITLAWEWEYVGTDGQAQPGARDQRAERTIVSSLRIPYHRYPMLLEGGSTFAPITMPDGTSASLHQAATLTGMPMVTFLVEEVPRLAGLTGVRIVRDPAIPDYRESETPAEVTLSIIERDGDRDWFDLVAEVTVDGEQVPFEQLFVALANDEPYLVLPSGTFCSLQNDRFQRLRALIEEARKLGEVHGDTISLSRFQAGLWDEFEELGIATQQVDAWRQLVSKLSNHASITRQPLPAGFTAKLRPYQQEGYDWLTFLYENGLGGVLADDMGLGKTVQTLALVSRQVEQRAGQAGRAAEAAQQVQEVQDRAARHSPFLVVAPTSVVANWAAETAKFAPSLSVVTLDGTVARNKTELRTLVGDADLVLTSYALFRIDFDHYNELEWAGLILDEAQFAKNHLSSTYRAARLLRAPFKLAITGTPMENNLMELWSMFSIAAPGLFGNPTHFTEYYQKPIEKDGNSERLEQLKRRITPLMLRRSKELVATELPPKQEQVLALDLNPSQRAIYDTYLQRERQKVLGLMEDLDGNRFQIFRSLTLLRQAALDVALVDEEHAGVPSTKLDALAEMLTEIIAEGHRTIIFSQFTTFLGSVRERLSAEGIAFEYLDGATTKRASVIQRFREGDAPVFLISLKSGGFGLNLTEADYCILLDPWWNPAAEAQAVDRTHRIGQTKQVMVYRFVATNTIEEKVMALKAGKDALFASVMGDGGGSGSAKLTAEDIRGLLE
ncbi:DEAD/DEAH box helicase [Leucobacter coleopterorum]|uniref:DEAD/DEAH box helicase n=1 Tax=Leucobacter coleopterorum TaxID=2714933 RepID=A0ABX6JZ09_9MICO|nr:DEAD/DEAH box helicase [Leucobacter coleopterorum]QIM19541.1 DEAD/DEAH box helicase [Leucobacter coleopterorum]